MYDEFAATFGRRHSSPEEYEHRRGVFHDNCRFIEDWNAQAHSSDSHMLGLNHFADWTQVGRFMHANHILFIELQALSAHFVKKSHSLTRSLTHSLARSLTHSLTHSLARSLTHSLTRSLTHLLTCSLARSLARLLGGLLMHVVLANINTRCHSMPFLLG